jgi:hypothetical protein
MASATVSLLETRIQELLALLERCESRLQLVLYAGGLAIPLERIGRREIVMREQHEVPLGPSCITITVDGVYLRTWHVRVVDVDGCLLEIEDV